jgi:hypothetical protein
MRRRFLFKLTLVVVFVGFFGIRLSAQSAYPPFSPFSNLIGGTVKDPNAVQVVQRAITAMGGTALIGQIRDSTPGVGGPKLLDRIGRNVDHRRRARNCGSHVGQGNPDGGYGHASNLVFRQFLWPASKGRIPPAINEDSESLRR